MSGHQIIRLRLQRPGGFRLEVDLSLPGAGITALFGPSGSGKTTVLRCVAGLEQAQEARVDVAGQCWEDSARRLSLPTWRRPLGYVFQEASLFAHLSVEANLAYGLRRRGGGAQALAEAVDLLGIGHLLARAVQGLSGGERQRVAIARALASRPQLLLLDEPMAALDAARRQEILPWLERLRDEARIPMLYVSHSSDEVARLADTLVLMDQGRVRAVGPVDQVLREAGATGTQDDAGVLLYGRVEARDAHWHLARIAFPGGTLWLPDGGKALSQPVRVRVLARDVSVATAQPQGTSVQNLLPCVVCEIRSEPHHPAQVLVRLRCGGNDDPGEAGDSTATELLARITARAAHDLALSPGRRVWAQVKAAALVE